MIKRALCTTLALLCSTAYADDPHWTFSYTGFYDQQAGHFDPAMGLSGTFTGEDLNHDQIIDKSELTSLKIGWRSYLSCPYEYPVISSCGVDAFSFNTANHSLQFSAFNSFTDENNGGGSVIDIITGDRIREYVHPWHADDYTLFSYWTDATTLAVTAPVPEPASYALLGAGALLLAYRRRRV